MVKLKASKLRGMKMDKLNQSKSTKTVNSMVNQFFYENGIKASEFELKNGDVIRELNG